MRMDPNQASPELIEKCARRDEEAFSKLVDIYSGRCYGYFHRLSGNADVSSELLSELFLRLVKKIDSFRGGEGSFDHWLFTMASNIFYDHLRKQKRYGKLIEGRQKLLLEQQGQKGSDCGENIDLLGKELARLDEQTRELLMLRYYGNLSFREIAEMRKEPVGTVLSKVHRGLAKLRQKMEQKP